MVPDLADLLATSRVVSLPMTTRFRGITVREAVLIEGPFGWTEFSPFVEYDDEEATAWLRAAIDFGWRAAPEPLRDRIPVNATVPAVPADQVPAVLARFPGTRTAKVKVAERGQTLTDDVERVRAVRDALGAEGRVRVDANALWNLDEAEHAIHALAPFDLEYVEQPCATVDELAELRRRIRYMGIPIAADESVRKAADPLAVAKAGAADIVIVKAQPLGGVHAARRIVAEAGLPAVVSSALDTSVGIAMGAHLAAALPELEFDCGLGTVALFAQDVADEPLRPVDGSIPVVRPSVSSARLDELQTDPERTQWWLDRLARCHRILERGLAL
ncbi:o-succinylbenzoate synthase [Leifsonia sp. 21MFCrub1.1]|uniref:o-succinylbenzoate synthase n=1 Tax=Leifsonia sp. 21MFCrub1.1 TaxID=1798223 RepID=UPI0008929130|nr:o-succinylbenzoate synthase [Leifsonia sp. 21MFCrub1.1]SEB12553.1 O-succinylbenzoate synthase [Leifsonia sp. 21MFCrub1.1]